MSLWQFLQGTSIEFRRRTLDDRMRVMTVGADRRRRIAVADQRAVNAAFPLLELVGMTAAADLGRGDRIAARALDVLFAGRMRGGSMSE